MEERLKKLEDRVDTVIKSYDGNFKTFSEVVDDLTAALKNLAIAQKNSDDLFAKLEAEDKAIRTDMTAENAIVRAQSDAKLEKALHMLTWKFLAGAVVAAGFFGYLIDVKLAHVLPFIAP